MPVTARTGSATAVGEGAEFRDHRPRLTQADLRVRAGPT